VSACLAIWALSASAGAGELPAQGTYKLKWLPYQPATASGVVQTAALEPVGPAPQRPRGGAFADPFGDNPDLSPMPDNQGAEDDRSEGSSPKKLIPATLDDLRLDFPSEGLPNEPPETDSQLLLEPTDRLLADAGDQPADECPSPYDPDYYKRITELNSDITPRDGEFPRECPVTDETIYPFAPGQVRYNVQGQSWGGTTFAWKASALCHKPLYFEDEHLERYGHSWGPRLQPVLSGARFFLTIPALPYMMGLYPPGECIYTLGHYRPGSCAPYMLDPLPLSVRAALAEGGVWTGMAALVP
jgi:hypothetical protein